MNSQSRSAARNLVTGTIAKYALLFVSIGIGIVLMPFTIGHLGKANYGLWMLVASLTYYFQLLDLGYGTGLVRHVTEADAKGDVEKVNQVLSTFVIVYSIIGAIAMVGTTVLAFVAVPRFPHLSPEQIRVGRWVLILLGLRMSIGFPMTVFGAVTNARQKFALNTWVAVGIACLNAVVTFVVLVSGYGLVPLVASTVAVSLLSYIAYASVALHVFPGMRLGVSRFSRSCLREVTSFSMYLFLINLSAQIGFNLDNVIVGAAIGTTAVAVYAVASRLADYQRQMCNQFNGLLFPIVVKFEANGDKAALRSTLVDGTRLAVSMVVGVTITLLAFARPLVLRWVGPGFEDGLPALYALAVAGIVLVGQGPLGNVLLAVGRHRLVTVGSLMEALLNMVLSLLLVRRYGITGVALGTMIATLVMNLFVLVPIACRTLGLTLLSFVSEATSPAAFAGLPAAIVAWLLRVYIAPASLPAIVLCCAVVCIVYVVLLGAIGLKRSERRRYFGYLRHLRVRESLLTT